MISALYFGSMCLKDLPEERGPGRCSSCGSCEGICPNNLPVRERLEQLKALT